MDSGWDDNGDGNCDGDGNGNPTPTPDIVWPLANSDAEDADSVHAPFGPRALPSQYDFHAGIDLPASTGTPVRAVLPGRVVLVSYWNGTSTGAGNAILVAHSADRSTSYLHLDEILVSEGDSVAIGQTLGAVGRTGASYAHLHLGYFEGLPRDTRVRDERLSRNPLALLPGASDALHASFPDDGVVLDMPLRRMRANEIRLHGAGGELRTLNYDQVVARGSTVRDEHVQDGVHVDAGRPDLGRFDLFLRADAPAFVVQRVVVLDFEGNVLLDRTRP